MVERDAPRRSGGSEYRRPVSARLIPLQRCRVGQANTHHGPRRGNARFVAPVRRAGRSMAECEVPMQVPRQRAWKTVTCAECHYLDRTNWIVVGYVTPGIPVLTPHRRNHCTARMHEASRIPADLWATHPAVLGMSGVRHSPLVCGAGYKRFRSLNPRVWH